MRAQAAAGDAQERSKGNTSGAPLQSEGPEPGRQEAGE